MLRTPSKPAAPQLAVVQGKVVIDVPWHLASAVQHHLHKYGIGGTLHLDPVAGEARLEIWDGVDDGDVRRLLAHWKP